MQPGPEPQPDSGTVEKDPHDLSLKLWFLVLDPHTLIYSTIILMTAYALYDEGSGTLVEGAALELAAIAVAPLFALMMAHAFSDALDFQIRYGRRLTRHDRWALLRKNVQYMYVAVPATLLLGLLTLLHWDADDGVALMLFLGLASLVMWGVFAGQKAGLGPWRQVSFGLSYGLMGLLVLIVELVIAH
ncbi:MAG: hypothetical protein Q8M17_03620 [Actinomycetota bacterium]|nr:hypothetical protein [Actinomycetota bacterium]